MTALLRTVLACAVLGYTALAHVHAQTDATRTARIAFVAVSSPSTAPRGFQKFWDRLRELGWIEGRNLNVDRRWVEGRPERLPGFMSEAAEHRVDVIVTQGTPAAIAARKATDQIPIVVLGMGDAVATGLAASLSHPGGNLTGLSHGWLEGFSAKWLELLQESLPALTTVAVVFNPTSPLCVQEVKELEAVAPRMKLALLPIEVRTPEAIDRAIPHARAKAQAVVVLTDPLTWQQQKKIAALTQKARLPSIYANLEFVDSGGLMAYGVDLAEVSVRGAEYVDKILRGAKPGDLPIEQPTQIRLVVNAKTAHAIGITLPQSLLMRADEVLR
jgi:putative ABC transport system substrate-binding protein